MSAIDPANEPPTVVGLLDGLLDGGVHVAGDLVIGLADVDLIRVALRLLVASEETAQRTGTRPDTPARHSATPAGPLARGPEPDPTAASSTPRRLRPAQPRPVGRRPAPGQEGKDTSIEAADRDQLIGGVSQLVLTVVEVIRDLIERQAVRRVEAGGLSDDEVERLGIALQALEERMSEIKAVFGVTDDDLNIDLGPLGRLR